MVYKFISERLISLSTICLLILPSVSNGQASVGGQSQWSNLRKPSTYAPATPNAATFERFGNLPVSHSSGIPQIDIPIHTIQLSNFNWPIKLSYHARGVRPSDVASNVGLGWNLDASAIISVSNGFTSPEEILRNLDLTFLSQSLSACIPSNEPDIILADGIAATDQNLAVYNIISGSGLNGKFFIKGNTGYSLPASNMKIVSDQIGFNITDINGNKYEFKTFSRTTKISACLSPQENINSKKPHITYFLTKIITSNQEEIYFNYADETYNYNAAPLEIRRNPSQFNLQNFCNALDTYMSSTLCQNSYLVNDKRLASIIVNNRERIEFNYSNQRVDLPGASRLIGVRIFRFEDGIEKPLSRVLINQSYFGTSQVAEETRLKATGIDILNVNDSTVKRFKLEYDETPLVSRMIGDYTFTGSVFDTYSYAEVRLSNAGILKRITYPTGGQTLFEYEVNKEIGQLRIKTIQDFDGKKVTNSRLFNYNDTPLNSYAGMFTDIETNYTINPQSGGPAAPNFLIQCSRVFWQSEPLGVRNSDGLLNRTFYRKVTELFESNGKNGKKIYHFELPQIELTESIVNTIPVDPILITEEVFERDVLGKFKLVTKTENEYIVDIDPELITSEPFPQSMDPLVNFYYIKNIHKVQDRMQVQWFVGGASNGGTGSTGGALPDYIFTVCPIYLKSDYRVISAPQHLKSTKTTRYLNGATDSIVEVTQYFYDDPINLSPTRIESTNSKGQPVISKFVYPTQTFNPSFGVLTASEQQALNSLREKNILATPYYTEASVNNAIIKKSFTSYQILSNGMVKELASRSYGPSDALVTELQYNSYTSFLPNQIKHDTKGPVSILYESRHFKPIAIFENASINQVAYSGFEDAHPSNVTFNPSARSNISFTGFKSVNLAISNITISGVAPGNYLISCWRNGNAVTANGTNLAGTISAAGWQLVSATITVSTSPITITGNALIDELKLHPLNSFSSSYSYNRFGILSQNDPANKVTKYEYDSFGRLKSVKDRENKILETYTQTYSNVTSNWQPTGVTRCQPCVFNNAYLSNLIEKQERDMNPSSPTYNTTRWTLNPETSLTCGGPSFESTTETRCQILDWQGTQTITGWNEIKQIDRNPCSSTFNDVRWVRHNLSLATCPPTRVFVKLTRRVDACIDPNSPDECIGSLVANFYNDLYCTSPANVSNLSITVQRSFFNTQQGVYGTQNQTFVCNGNQTVLASNLPIHVMSSTQPEILEFLYENSYLLLDGPNYDIGIRPL